MPTVVVEACSDPWHCEVSEGKVTSELWVLTVPQISQVIMAKLGGKTFLSVSTGLLLGVSLFCFLKVLPMFVPHLSQVFPALFCTPLACYSVLVATWRSQGFIHKSSDFPGHLSSCCFCLFSCIFHCALVQGTGGPACSRYVVSLSIHDALGSFIMLFIKATNDPVSHVLIILFMSIVLGGGFSCIDQYDFLITL